MKSCLKSATSTPPSSSTTTPGNVTPTDGTSTPHRPRCEKHVSWCSDGEEEVYEADDWDRTPSAVCRKLTYGEILELKAIQRMLPQAQQHPDNYTSRTPRLLKQVPIGLLPLLPDGQCSTSQAPSYPHSESGTSSPITPPPSRATPSPPVTPHHPPSPPSTPPPPKPSPLASTPFTAPISIRPSPPAPMPPPPAPAPFTASSAPPRRKLALSFLPLLPTEDPAPAPTITTTTTEPAKPQPPQPTEQSSVPGQLLADSAMPSQPPEPKQLESKPDAPSTEPTSSQLPTPSGTPALKTCELEAEVSMLLTPEPTPPTEGTPSTSADATTPTLPSTPMLAPSKVHEDGETDSAQPQLPTPGSTPALTPCSLASDTESSSSPGTPSDTSDPTVYVPPPPLPRATASGHLLDAFPAPPTALPESPVGSRRPSASESSDMPTLADEGPLSPPTAADQLAARLGALMTVRTPSPSTTASSSVSPTGLSNNNAATAAVLSQSYFYLPLQRPRPASAIPSHLQPAGLGAGGGMTHEALPDSPFVDPMLGARGGHNPMRATVNGADAAEKARWDGATVGAGQNPYFPLTLPPPSPGKGPNVAAVAFPSALHGLRLEALPSPALLPPSPLLLNAVETAAATGETVVVTGPVPPTSLGTARRSVLLATGGSPASSPLANDSSP